MDSDKKKRHDILSLCILAGVVILAGLLSISCVGQAARARFEATSSSGPAYSAMLDN